MQRMGNLMALVAAVAMLALPLGAAAVDFMEMGDAPSLLPGQELPGGTTRVLGDLETDIDIDLYGFAWSGGVLVIDTFGSPEDTQLHLFDSAGFGIGENDDAAQGGLQSEIALDLPAGSYFIAITAFNNDALDATGLDIFGFNNTFEDLNGNFIQGPEGNGALADWDFLAFGGTGEYFINFSSPVGDGGPSFTLLQPQPGEAGGRNDFITRDGNVGRAVALYAGRDAGSTTISLGPCSTTLGVSGARLVGIELDDDNDGSVTITRNVPAEAAGTTLFLQAVDVFACVTGEGEDVSNVVSEEF